MALLVGASDRSSNGVPLPFDLTTLGAPGCSVYVSTGVTMPMPRRHASQWVGAQQSFPYSGLAHAGGTPLYAQAIAADPAANALGIATFPAARFDIPIVSSPPLTVRRTNSPRSLVLNRTGHGNLAVAG